MQDYRLYETQIASIFGRADDTTSRNYEQRLSVSEPIEPIFRKKKQNWTPLHRKRDNFGKRIRND